MQKVLGSEDEHRTQIPIPIHLTDEENLAIKENLVCPFLLGARAL